MHALAIDSPWALLRRLFHGLAGLLLATGVLGLVWLSSDSLRHLEGKRLEEQARQFERQAARLEAHLLRANDHILRMRILAERAWAEAPASEASAPLPVFRAGVLIGHSWDRPGGRPGGAAGNLFSAGAPASPDALREAVMVSRVWDYVGAQHVADPALRWSHYTSLERPVVAFYPYMSLEALLRTRGDRDLDAFFVRALDAGTRAAMVQDAEASPVTWSRFYADEAGAGTVFTVYGPVRDGARLLGTIGSDISVDDFLLPLLRESAVPGTELRLINPAGGSADSAGRVLLDARPAPAPIDGWRQDGEELVARQRLRTAPLLLETRVPLAAVLEPVRAIELRLQLLGLAALLLYLGAWLVATRYVVRPSLELAEVLADQRSPDSARLPGPWRRVLQRLQALGTERERLNAALREERDLLERRVGERTAELQRLNRELQAFNHAVSHDLRAPARSMAGFASILREEHAAQLDAEGLAHLGRIEQGARRMGEMIDGLVRLSRLERHELLREEVDLSALCGQVVEELRREDPVRSVEVTIEPGLRVHADRSLLRSAVENLLGNAWKFTANAPAARIRVYAEPAGAGQAICVEDNGAGFDPAMAERLFAPFQRGHTEAEFAGTGIGLSTVKRIVERHGGTIVASGAPGRGACMRFVLPEAGGAPPEAAH